MRIKGSPALHKPFYAGPGIGVQLCAIQIAPWVLDDAIDGLKFADCLPRPLAAEIIAARLQDPASVAVARAEPVAGWHQGQGVDPASR